MSGTELPDITAGIDPGGLQDIILAIQDVCLDSDGNRTISAAGKFEETLVGLEVFIKAGMRRGLTLVGDDAQIDHVHRDGIVFRSVGVASDNLVAALSRLYRVAHSYPRMRENITFDGIVLDGNPERIEQEHVLTKLFHDPWDRNEEYCELYLHVDLPKGLIGIDEKDEEYRPAVLRALMPR